jgi:hypothetical protein
MTIVGERALQAALERQPDGVRLARTAAAEP